jgi:prepilin-type N-terminal cleavage/methylation domain-containing protein
MTARRGATLIELIVVIAILSVIAGVTTLGFRSRPSHRVIDPAEADVAAARDSALRSGHAVRVMVHAGGDSIAPPLFATALPDGRVIASTGLGFDPLTGRHVDAQR